MPNFCRLAFCLQLISCFALSAQPVLAESHRDSGSDVETLVDIHELKVDEDSAMATLVEKAKAYIDHAKAVNPALETIHINVMLGDAASNNGAVRNAQATHLAKIVHQYAQNSDVIVIEPTAAFRHHMHIPISSAMERHAEDSLKPKRLRLVAIRRVIVGVITALSIYIDTESLWSSLLAGVAGGAMSGELQRINTDYAAWLQSSAIWDPNGRLKRSSHPFWKISYGAWRTGRSATIVAGFITAVYFAALAGENIAMVMQFEQLPTLADIKLPYTNRTWLWSTGVPSLLSALSFGRWKQNEAKLIQDYLEDNRIRNYANIKTGEGVAKRIIHNGQLAAIVISAVSVLCETLAISEHSRNLSLATMSVAMVTGWTYAYWRFSGHDSTQTPSKLKIHERAAGLWHKLRDAAVYCSSAF